MTKNSSRKKWLVVLAVCGVFPVLFVVSVYFQFKNGSHDATVRTAFSELIAWRVLELEERQGVISLPAESDAWQDDELGEFFAPFINQLEPGYIALSSRVTEKT